MKSIKIILLSVIVGLAFISCKKEDTKTTTKIPVKNTKVIHKDVVTWKGYKPTGSHHGVINLKENSLKISNNTISGSVIIDMSTIKNNDLKDPKYNADLVNHLKSKDFFDVATYPTAKFEITNSSSDKENVYELEGNLTIKDITKKIKVPAKISTNENGETILRSRVFKIDRTDFGVKYKSKKFFDNLKDKFINDKFDLYFKIKLNK